MYYVYSHKNLKNGEVFYVGMGTMKRAGDLYRKSNPQHWEYCKLYKLKEHDVYITLHHECMDRLEALRVEDFFIAHFHRTVVNIENNPQKKLRLRHFGGSDSNRTRLKELNKKYSILKQKPVKCITDGLIYDSIADAARFYDCDSGEIGKVCKGKRARCKGRVFEYWQKTNSSLCSKSMVSLI